MANKDKNTDTQEPEKIIQKYRMAPMSEHTLSNEREIASRLPALVRSSKLNQGVRDEGG